MPSGPAAFLALILLSSFLSWFVVRDKLEQGCCELNVVGRGVHVWVGRYTGAADDGGFSREDWTGGGADVI